MRLFFSHFEKKTDEEEKNKKAALKEYRRRKKKACMTFAVILLLLINIYAQPVAAYPGEGLVNSFKEKLHENSGYVAAAVGMLVTGGCLVALGVPTGGAGAVAGFGECLAAGGAAAAGVGLYLSGSASKTGGGDGGGAVYTQTNATINDLESDDDTANMAKALDDSQQAAYAKIAELNAMLRSDLTVYDFNENGSTGDLWARVYAPEKVYGFSAFPVQVKLYTKESNIPFSVVHIKRVQIYIKENNSTSPLWIRTWDYGESGSEGMNGESAVYSTVLKVPDPYAYQVKQMVDSGQIDKELIMQIFQNATTKPWEIFVDISAYREEWQNDPQYTDQSSCEAQPNHKWDSNTSTCYEKISDKDIDYHLQTTSAYKHITMANDLAILNEGMYASLPVKFVSTALASKWSLYQETFAGAVSNFITLTYASPVHVMGSTADYRFYLAPNPDYFSPLNVSMTDDFRFFTVRVLNGGSWELADNVFGNLGTLAEAGTPKELNAHYTTASDILTYEVFGITYFTIERSDGITIPIWEIVWPKVSVEPNTRIVMDDTQVHQIVVIVNQSEINNETLSKLKSQVQALIDGLNEKLQSAKAFEANAEGVGNTQAAGYAKKAEMAYQAAIDALNHATSSDNKQLIINYLNAAKKYEQAGDFYMAAAQKALYGAPEQAKLDAQMGDQLMNLASQYEPHIDIFGTAKSLLKYKVLGIPLWALLVILFVLVGAVVLWKKVL